MPKHAKSLERFLDEKYGNKIKVTTCKDKRVTGNFSVTVGDKILQERTTRIGGKCATREERQALCKQIDSILNEKER